MYAQYVGNQFICLPIKFILLSPEYIEEIVDNSSLSFLLIIFKLLKKYFKKTFSFFSKPTYNVNESQTKIINYSLQINAFYWLFRRA